MVIGEGSAVVDYNTQKVTNHEDLQEEVYWSDFYSHTDFKNGSTFFDLINGLPSIPKTIIDIGCGQGRDSFAFAHVGKHVTGLDRSEIGIRNANEKAVASDLGSSLSFSVCDVSNWQGLYDNLDKAREQGGGSICYYMRFFLHSIPEDTQDTLMRAISSNAQPEDIFAAEFRTDKDEERAKAFGNSHYRRYQNADSFSEKLKGDYGWHNVVFETEEQGLSVYGDEDPILYRVVTAR